VVPLKKNVDEALTKTNLVKTVVVFERTGSPVNMTPSATFGGRTGRHRIDRLPRRADGQRGSAVRPLHLRLHGKAKGIIHTTGGYMVGTYVTTKYVFDLRTTTSTGARRRRLGHRAQLHRVRAAEQRRDVHDVRGRPELSRLQRFWSIIERHKVTSSTPRPLRSARSCARAGSSWTSTISRRCAARHGRRADQSRSVDVVSGRRRHKKCPIVDTWWQTETGLDDDHAAARRHATKPGTATLPFFGVDAAIVDRQGKELGPNQGGLLGHPQALGRAMLRGIFNDPDPLREAVLERRPGMYFTGDGARRDNDGYFWIMAGSTTC
jgi:acetyl-CoA synthetase